MYKTQTILVMSLLALFVTISTAYGQKKVITFNMSYEPGWEVKSDIDQIPGKVIACPMVDSLKHLYVWTGNSPVDLVMMDSVCFYDLSGKYTERGIKATKHLTAIWSDNQMKWGIVIKKFPLWIQFGYRDDQGVMVLSRRYRYAKKM